MLTLLRIFDLICDPAWLAVILAFLANYENMQEGTLKLRRDIKEILSEIWDLLKKQLHQSILVGIEMLAQLADQGEKEASKWAGRFRRTSDVLRGISDG